MADENDNDKKETTVKAIVPFVEGKGLVPNDLDGMWRLASIMANSGLMPAGLDKPESAFIALQMGFELGLSPMQAAQNIAVINKRPVLWGDAPLAIVRTSGHLAKIEERTEGEGLEFKATCIAHRVGVDAPTARTFGMSNAKKAGLLTKDSWAKYPERMCAMRARSWALRDLFGDVLKGIRSAADVDIEAVSEPTDVTPGPDEPGPSGAPGPAPDIKEVYKPKQAPTREASTKKEVIDKLVGKKPAPGQTTPIDGTDLVLTIMRTIVVQGREYPCREYEDVNLVEAGETGQTEQIAAVWREALESSDLTDFMKGQFGQADAILKVKSTPSEKTGLYRVGAGSVWQKEPTYVYWLRKNIAEGDRQTMVTIELVEAIAKHDSVVIKKVLADYKAQIIGDLTLEDAKNVLAACQEIEKEEPEADPDELAKLNKKLGAKYADCTLAEKYRLAEFLFIRTGKSLKAWTSKNLDQLKGLQLDSPVLVAHCAKWESFQRAEKLPGPDGFDPLPWPLTPTAEGVEEAKCNCGAEDGGMHVTDCPCWMEDLEEKTLQDELAAEGLYEKDQKVILGGEQLATIESYDPETGRYSVVVDETGEGFQVNPQDLAPFGAETSKEYEAADLGDLLPQMCKRCGHDRADDPPHHKHCPDINREPVVRDLFETIRTGAKFAQDAVEAIGWKIAGEKEDIDEGTATSRMLGLIPTMSVGDLENWRNELNKM